MSSLVCWEMRCFSLFLINLSSLIVCSHLTNHCRASLFSFSLSSVTSVIGLESLKFPIKALVCVNILLFHPICAQLHLDSLDKVSLDVSSHHLTPLLPNDSSFYSLMLRSYVTVRVYDGQGMGLIIFLYKNMVPKWYKINVIFLITMVVLCHMILQLTQCLYDAVQYHYQCYIQVLKINVC